jgi:hypothetical protein
VESGLSIYCSTQENNHAACRTTAGRVQGQFIQICDFLTVLYTGSSLQFSLHTDLGDVNQLKSSTASSPKGNLIAHVFFLFLDRHVRRHVNWKDEPGIEICGRFIQGRKASDSRSLFHYQATAC